MSEQVTDWLYIDKHGQPIRDGWYEVLYMHHDDYEEPVARYFLDGEWYSDEKLKYTAFGTGFTKGERWRGLASDPSLTSKEAK